MSWIPTSKAYVFTSLESEPVPIGVIQLRQDVFEFGYAKSWLARGHAAFAVDPIHLPLGDTIFRSSKLFEAFEDSLPDNWGRRVLTATHRQHPANELEWLLACSGSGAGCLLYSGSPQRVKSPTPSPDFSQLTELMYAVNEIDARHTLNDERLVRALWQGSSMGGARPKVTVLLDGEEWIAKLSRLDDTFDQARAEYAFMQLAKMAGIHTAETRLIEVAGKAVLLVRRFDREAQARKHYLSAHTLLGMRRIRPNDDAKDYSYAGIAKVIRKISATPECDTRELFRRMAFNVAIANTDDHDRNHGFLMEPTGAYRLSPAFDVLPHATTSPRLHGLGIGTNGRLGTLGNVLSRATEFGLSLAEAHLVIDEIQTVLAEKMGDVFLDSGLAEADRDHLRRMVRGTFEEESERPNHKKTRPTSPSI